MPGDTLEILSVVCESMLVTVLLRYLALAKCRTPLASKDATRLQTIHI